MDDRELLELAAKAAGIDAPQYVNGSGAWVFFKPRTPNWNPLTDDGDALRLAVALNLAIGNETTSAVGGTSGAALMPITHVAEHHNGDPYAATRRAIVRAAAEIGKAML